MNGHLDVNIPRAMQRYTGAGMVVLFHHLRDLGYDPHYRLKEAGGHICDTRIYVLLDAQQNSEVSFGSTVLKKVNPTPHLWCRGERDWINAAYAILQSFVTDMFSQWCAQTTVQRTMLGTFIPDEWGPEYLLAVKDESVEEIKRPRGVAAEGWAFVLTRNNKAGWVPAAWLA